jgi:hypothetical protein
MEGHRASAIDAIRRAYHVRVKDCLGREGYRRATSAVAFPLLASSSEEEVAARNSFGNFGTLIKLTSRSHVRQLSGKEAADWLGIPLVVRDARFEGPFDFYYWPYSFSSVKIDSAKVTQLRTGPNEGLMKIEFKTFIDSNLDNDLHMRHENATCWADHRVHPKWLPTETVGRPRLYNAHYLVSVEELAHRRYLRFHRMSLAREDQLSMIEQEQVRLQELIRDGLATKTYDYDESGYQTWTGRVYKDFMGR